VTIILLLIPLGLVLVAIAIWAFFWAVDHDQFDDLDRPARAILFDDDLPPGGGDEALREDPKRDAPRRTARDA
jgi:cbb3-type cytochrome oxidase maturation protein